MKIKFRKICYIINIIMLLFLISFPTKAIDETNYEKVENEFLQTINKMYSEYSYIEDISFVTDDYIFLAYIGISKNVPSVSILFSSITNEIYDLIVSIDDIDYTFNDSKINSSFQTIYNLKTDKTNILHIVKDNKVYKSIKINRFTTEQVQIKFKDSLVTGFNEGYKDLKLSLYRTRLKFLPTLLMVSISIISLCLVFLIFMLIFRKGLFNKDKRKEGIVNMKKVVEEMNLDHQVKEDFWNDSITNYNSNTVEEVKVENIIDDNNESETSNLNIKEYLQDLGFITDYQVLSEEEKNRIMLELMKLKDSKKISLKDYYEETYKLWKK